MKRLPPFATLLLLAFPLASITGCVVAPGYSHPRTSVGASVVDGRLSSFYLSLGEYYRVPERDIRFIHERHIPDHDIPVVLFISRHAHIAPAIIIDFRLAGLSWMDISLRFGLAPDIFYVPVQSIYGPPYGNAYGHYQRHQRSEWHKIRLADEDIMNLVNLRFISERYRVPPEDVMRMRSGGKNFVTIHDEVHRRPGDRDFRQQERGKAPEPAMRQEKREQEREPALQQIESNNGHRPQERESVIQQNKPIREDRQGQVEERRQTRSESRERTEQQMNRQIQESKPGEIRQQERNKAQESTKKTPQEPHQKARQQERRESQEAADKDERKGRSPTSNGEPERR